MPMRKLILAASLLAAVGTQAYAACLPEFPAPAIGDLYMNEVYTINFHCLRAERACRKTHDRKACATRDWLSNTLTRQAE
jgi:hypothetical protein